MRLFIALPLSSSVENNLAVIIEKLKNYGGKVKWVDPGQIHITVRFLGETNEHQIPFIKEIIDNISTKYNSYNLSIDRLGGFPNLNKPRVIWAGFTDDDQINIMARMVKEVEYDIRKLGFDPDEKRFRPHLTLGRVKVPNGLEELLDAIRSYQIEPITVKLDRLRLYQSTLTPQGPIYECLHEVMLGKQDRFGD
ncbi:MAG: RNA 2',3'-cyclic phosphodiesterase [bacterium]